MLLKFNGFSRVTAWLYKSVILVFSYYYLCVLSLVLLLFVSYRFPYCYRPFLFRIFLLTVVFTRFLSLFLRRILAEPSVFFSRFVPVGTPLYICPLVCLAETIRFLIRPFVLIFRPFINISLGCFGAVAISKLCFHSNLLILLLAFIFFYEVFVALVHWFIVAKILSFSIDH